MPLIGLSRHIVVGDTDKEAQSAAKRAFALWYDALIHLWRAHGVGLPRQMIPAEFEPALDRRLHHRRFARDGARAAEARQRDRRHQLLPLPAGVRRSVVRGIEALGRAVRAGSDARALNRCVAMRAAVEHRAGLATTDLDHVLAVLAPLLEEQRDAGGRALRTQRAEPVGIGRPRPRSALAAGDDPAQSRRR